ncbi:AHH domain-containing protein [Corallococcus sp. M34]|uniref:AHH domain-containing protein n=1 Tax=Citreicoccus inhibens TaxID=2849499 RepID=UPI001C22601E|nr:AHH domain-containing protein [Citreicoccus inhibens]MBU8897876.1 AHH domain-containing protein [Citreicoccus inhibens]
MSSKDHLVDWKENEHKTSPTTTGCLWRHVDYGAKDFPRCNYRKNAHDYSKAAEKNIYNIPNFRSPERWVNIWLDRLGPTLTKRGTAVAKSHPSTPASGAWDIDRGDNFTEWKTPYWHNTHHVIACGEIQEAFPDATEQAIILASRWNINEMPNVIILPKQYTVARILKLPTHVPPDGPAEHAGYSRELGKRLNELKAKLAKNKNQTDHKLTDANKDDCRKELEKASSAIRQFIIDSGEKNPGINLDNLKLDSINW